MKNPLRTRYRIIETPGRTQPYQPQLWRWYWPLWAPLTYTSYTGFDATPRSYDTLDDARDAIERYRSQEWPKVRVHRVP